MVVGGNAEFGGTGDVWLGINGPATFRQEGSSTVNPHNLIVGHTNTAAYYFVNGRLEATNLTVGHYSSSTMQMDDGNLVIHGGTKIGYEGGAPGRFQWNGGVIAAGIQVSSDSAVALGRDFRLNYLVSGHTNPDFHGTLDARAGALEITGRATALMDAPSAFEPDFEVTELRIGSSYGIGELHLAMGSIYVGENLEMWRGGAEGPPENSVLRTLVKGTTAGDDYGQVLNRSGKTPAADVSGELNVAFVQDFAPSAGDTFDIVDGFGTIDGDFHRVVVEGLIGDFEYDLSTTGGRVRFTAVTDGTAGDGRLEEVDVGSDGFASLGGGKAQKGGMDLLLPDTVGGRLRGRIGRVGKDATDGILPPVPGGILGSRLSKIQFWDLEYDGSFGGDAELELTYDDSILGGESEYSLGIFHFSSSLGKWHLLDTLEHDLLSNRLRVKTDSFSPFILGYTGYVPEPASGALLALAVFTAIRRRQ
jgi:hypothetical protein